eukprot:627376-Rhodomonas_salina.2
MQCPALAYRIGSCLAMLLNVRCHGTRIAMQCPVLTERIVLISPRARCTVRSTARAYSPIRCVLCGVRYCVLCGVLCGVRY